MPNTHTSLEFSRWLKEKGFEGESEKRWRCSCLGSNSIENTKQEPNQWTTQECCKYYPAYDIMNDLCIRYKKEIFGEEVKGSGFYRCFQRDLDYQEYDERLEPSYERHSRIVLTLLQEGNKEGAEKYITQHSILNKEELKR